MCCKSILNSIYRKVNVTEKGRKELKAGKIAEVKEEPATELEMLVAANKAKKAKKK